MTLYELGAASPTEDFQAGRKKVAHRIEDFVNALSPTEHQSGAIFFERFGILGCEWLASADLFGRAAEKIIRSFAFEALDGEAIENIPGEIVSSWWDQLMAAEPSLRKSPGVGEDLRVTTASTIGSGLLWEGLLMHFSCFAR